MPTAQSEVTLIASFYNVENCVDYCLESILGQVCKDFETILVDDGSTDSTSEKLDRYGAMERIRVFHKPNGGLSDARNYAIERATTPYITIIDGDDIISPYYIECLLSAREITNADLVVGGVKTVKFPKVRECTWELPQELTVLNQSQGLDALLYERITETSCAKLLPRDVYLRYPFPKGHVYEEITTATNHFLNGHVIAWIPEPLYGYVMRPGSVVRSKKADIAAYNDYKKAVNSFFQPIRSVSISHEKPMAFRRALFIARMHALLMRTNASREWIYGEDETLREDLADLNSVIANDENVPLRYKTRFWLLEKVPGFYDYAMRLYDVVKGRPRG